MKNTLKLLLWASLFLSLFGCQQASKEILNEYSIIPLPNQIAPQEGRFQLTDKVFIVTTDCTPEVQAIAENFSNHLQKVSDISMQKKLRMN